MGFEAYSLTESYAHGHEVLPAKMRLVSRGGQPGQASSVAESSRRGAVMSDVGFEPMLQKPRLRIPSFKLYIRLPGWRNAEHGRLG